MSRRTIAVTVGTQPSRIHTTLQRLAGEESLQNNIEHVAIDTADLDNQSLPADVSRHVMTTSKRFQRRVEDAEYREEVPYLHGIGVLPDQGAARNRALGRAQGEYHSGELYRLLRDRIHEQVKNDDEVSEIMVVVMAALGGGSGSSLSILTSLICDAIAQNISADTTVDADVRVVGAMTVSKLEHQRHTLAIPNAEQHLNNHAALRELAAIQGLSSSQLPDRIRFPMSPDDPDSLSSLPLEPPVLDGLFLIPLDESKLEPPHERDEARDHAEAVNWTFAHLVAAFARSENDIENLFQENGPLNQPLYTVDVVDARAPVELAVDYLDIKADRDDLARELGIDPTDHVSLSEVTERVAIGADTLLERLQRHGEDDPAVVVGAEEQLRASNDDDDEVTPLEELLGDLDKEVSDDEQIKQLETEREFLSLVLAQNFEPGTIPMVVSESPLAESAKDTRDWLTSITCSDIDVDDVETKQTAVIDGVAEGPGPRNRKALMKYVFLRMVMAQLTHVHSTHPFEDSAGAAWEKWHDEALRLSPGIENASITDQFEQGIRPAIEDELSQVEQQLEDTSPARILRRRKLARQKKRLEDELTELNRSHDQYTALSDLRTQVESTLLAPVRTTVEETRDRIATRIEELRQARRATRIRLREKEAELVSAKADLTGTDTRHVERLPFDIESLEDVNPDMLESAESLNALRRRGVLSDTDVARRLNTLLEDRLGEPLEDYERRDANATPSGLLATVTASENEELLSLDPSDGRSVPTVRNTQFPAERRFSVTGLDRPFSIGFLTIFKDVSLSNMSEIRWVDEQRQRGTLDDEVRGVNSTAFSEYVAWPELLPNPQPGGYSAFADGDVRADGRGEGGDT